ncbi:GNAT family N-acetyltransferase [Humisphaera borealis]|uniref:GNAT family N-acetyltransferase n=1 Tax=Humisphaera borealis TaxID=2807512 RepID=A0A7M2X2B6_9BACT|nr:GNAT family N-acetyltransferase [Humisphaera borealis]QOV91863.1 GNAT family N-acetyltransferase [Humisphaera borealis]
MELRPVTPNDLALLGEIDGTIETRQYLHIERSGTGLAASWQIHERPLRERIVRANPIDDERRLMLKMIATGADEGVAMMASHDDMPVALVAAVPEPALGTLRIAELRVDFDLRRQGLASALVYSMIAEAKTRGLRAVSAETTTDNFPAAQLLSRCGFEITGLDERRRSNHDLVKETVSIFWHASLD